MNRGRLAAIRIATTCFLILLAAPNVALGRRQAQKGASRAAAPSSRRDTPPVSNTKIAGRDFWTKPINSRNVFDHKEINRVIGDGFNVYLPNKGSAWEVDGPVYGFGPNCHYLGGESGGIGVGAGTTELLSDGYYKGPLIVLAGRMNNPEPHSYVNLEGILDRSAGRRYGLATRGGRQYLISWGAGFQLSGAAGHGRAWTDDLYTMALAAVPAKEGVPGGRIDTTELFAIGSARENFARPFLFVCEKGSYFFSYFAADRKKRSIRWNDPPGGRIRRYFIFIDVKRKSFPHLINIYMDSGDGPVAVKVTNGRQEDPPPGVGLEPALGLPFVCGSGESIIARELRRFHGIQRLDHRGGSL